jgi:membrane peptidoglycan carboxypeptidase
MWLIDKLAEQHISEAIKRGELDNLEGSGKPLQLDDDRDVPEHLRAAYRVLKNAGYLPPELELKKVIRDVEQLLAHSDDAAQQDRLNKRLRYLMTQYSLKQGSDLRLEQAYYEKLQARLMESK